MKINKTQSQAIAKKILKELKEERDKKTAITQIELQDIVLKEHDEFKESSDYQILKKYGYGSHRVRIRGNYKGVVYDTLRTNVKFNYSFSVNGFWVYCYFKGLKPLPTFDDLTNEIIIETIEENMDLDNLITKIKAIYA